MKNNTQLAVAYSGVDFSEYVPSTMKPWLEQSVTPNGTLQYSHSRNSKQKSFRKSLKVNETLK